MDQSPRTPPPQCEDGPKLVVPSKKSGHATKSKKNDTSPWRFYWCVVLRVFGKKLILVGGFSPTPLRNMFVKMGLISQSRGEH